MDVFSVVPRELRGTTHSLATPTHQYVQPDSRHGAVRHSCNRYSNNQNTSPDISMRTKWHQPSMLCGRSPTETSPDLWDTNHVLRRNLLSMLRGRGRTVLPSIDTVLPSLRLSPYGPRSEGPHIRVLGSVDERCPNCPEPSTGLDCSSEHCLEDVRPHLQGQKHHRYQLGYVSRITACDLEW